MGFIFGMLVPAAFSQTRQTPKQYIERYDQDAVAEMLKSGVPASITLSQGMLESDYGNSKLAKEAKNHFGIKCHSTWTGGRYTMDDDAKDECFRVYNSVYESFVDHSDFLRRNRRYAFLFELKRTDYKGWAHGLKKAGYATNPKYPELLINIIEANNLDRFDKMEKGDLKALGGSSKDIDDNHVASSGASSGGKSTSGSKTSGKKGVQMSDNNIKYVIAEQNETTESVAKRTRLGRWQIVAYNGFQKGQAIPEGTVVYLQPKRGSFKGEQTEHVVKNGDTMWKISQQYGVKLNRLYRKNKLKKGDPIKIGQKIRLK
ncbi:MAG: glucosaminidase domain-containing protein [Flavobacteriales bacterium]|nr:glucosaminidase domain-containing protein [Flavobacteriales bacterium]